MHFVVAAYLSFYDGNDAILRGFGTHGYMYIGYVVVVWLSTWQCSLGNVQFEYGMS
jgi:hypothetical protein